jgi:hypothetical protein
MPTIFLHSSDEEAISDVEQQSLQENRPFGERVDQTALSETKDATEGPLEDGPSRTANLLRNSNPLTSSASDPGRRTAISSGCIHWLKPN